MDREYGEPFCTVFISEGRITKTYTVDNEAIHKRADEVQDFVRNIINHRDYKKGFWRWDINKTITSAIGECLSDHDK